MSDKEKQFLIGAQGIIDGQGAKHEVVMERIRTSLSKTNLSEKARTAIIDYMNALQEGLHLGLQGSLDLMKHIVAVEGELPEDI